ncbi:MAG TPA: NADH-quinone oxidoreductase subunit J [Acidimicrobiales bacterium]|nr:NADH-quinone oxidoreductase subunit J [Acidimicrobiales bacterium]
MSALLLATTHPTVPDLAVFIFASALMIGGAVGVVTSANPVHAALSLVGTLFGVAVLFIEQQADFLAAVQIIVYAGAIVVLFLFVIMFLGVDRRENIETEPLKGQRPVAVLLILASVGGVIALGVQAHWASGAHTVTYPINGAHGEVGQIGKAVFTTYLFAFEATAALLLIAVVGAVVLARRPPRDAGEADTPEASDAVAADGDAGGEAPALEAAPAELAGQESARQEVPVGQAEEVAP